MVLSRLSSFDPSKPLTEIYTCFKAKNLLFIPSHTEQSGQIVFHEELTQLTSIHVPTPPPSSTHNCSSILEYGRGVPLGHVLATSGSGVSGCLLSTITQNKRGYRVQNTPVFIWHPTCKVEQNRLIVTPKPINVSICPNITPFTKEQCKSLFFSFLSVMNKNVYFKRLRRLVNFTTSGKKRNTLHNHLRRDKAIKSNITNKLLKENVCFSVHERHFQWLIKRKKKSKMTVVTVEYFQIARR